MTRKLKLVQTPTQAQIHGKAGGLIGGHRRRDSLTPERRKEIAQAAARARWGEPKA